MFEYEPDHDVIPVRPDERLPEAELAEALRGKLTGAENPLRVSQFGGGAANLTYLLDYGTHQYVLRRPPLGPVARSAHDMRREYRVLSILHRAFPYAPRAYLYHADERLLGSDFFIMERKRGVVVRRSMPADYKDNSDAARRMGLALVDTLVALHAVDYQALDLGSLGRPKGFVSRQIEGWYRRWQDADGDKLAAIDDVYHWLGSNIPEASRFTLVHNDYKLDNVMFSPSDPGTMVAVFDWDMCTLGDPLCDLGALLAYWTEPTDPAYFQGMASMPLGPVGFPSRRELVTRYATTSGQSVADVNFYYSLSLFRLTVILAQIFVRYVRGQTQDARFAALGDVIPLVARAAQDVASGEIKVV